MIIMKNISHKKIKKTEKKERVYLDFASQTMPSQKVFKEMKRVEKYNLNPASLYQEGLQAENLLGEARLSVARILGVKSHEIYFTNSSTLSSALAIFGTVGNYEDNFKKNKNYKKPHIITSNIEHPAILKNIEYLEKEKRIEVSYLETNQAGFIDKESIKKHIKENTILISIMYVNNEIGTIQEIKNISKKIKEWKRENKKSILDYPYFHTDASQAGNYLSLYVDTLGVDMLSLNGSKIYGPKSSAILFKKENIKVSPFYFGGNQERGFFSGTQDIERATGLATALSEAQNKIKNGKALESLANKRNSLLDNIFKNIKEAKLNAYINKSDWKEEKTGIIKEDRTSKRVPSNISLWLPNFPSDEMVIRLDQKGFAISAGSACSAKSDDYSHVIYNLYKNKIKKSEAEKIARESIRITINNDTKEEDLKRFVKVLKEIYYKFKK